MGAWVTMMQRTDSRIKSIQVHIQALPCLSITSSILAHQDSIISKSPCTEPQMTIWSMLWLRQDGSLKQKKLGSDVTWESVNRTLGLNHKHKIIFEYWGVFSQGMLALTHIGDAMDMESVEAAWKNMDDCKIVVSTLGGSPADPAVDSLGNINLINAAINNGVERFVLVTSIGTGDSKDAPPPQARFQDVEGFMSKCLSEPDFSYPCTYPFDNQLLNAWFLSSFRSSLFHVQTWARSFDRHL